MQVSDFGTTQIAYFSMEIALRTEMHTYSGGLGVLAGDAARSAADLHLPMVFVTLISRKGYLHQELDAAGRQTALPDPWSPETWAEPLDAMVNLTLGGRAVWIRPWLYVHVCERGNRIPVLLLDTDLEQNHPDDRDITDFLYGGDAAYRLKQEAVLGIGGVRALRALGFHIRTFHMNEGHAALLALELLQTKDRGPRNAAAVASCIFTTHTPIEAGHDQFPYETVEAVLGDFAPLEEIKRYAGAESCNMTRLALNLSGYVNSVANRHAETTRRMFPGYAIGAITNGVHTATWAHGAFRRLYDAQIGPWRHEPEVLLRADQLDDSDLWRAHMQAKSDLIAYIENATGKIFNPDVPLLGFARRMTGYKRPELLFSDLERLKALAQTHPFQLVFAGKSHPKDMNGQNLIMQLHAAIAALEDDIPAVFLPNYDLTIASKLVSGCDVWLNTPLPPMEASGTSGMKAAVNGVLNFSVLDGWWIEAHIEGVTGWAIGADQTDGYETHARMLYEKLSDVVLPLYYGDRAKWIWMMKQSISKIASTFNSNRMMRRYAAEAYLRP
jgi:starch phosphorylase